ncbi:MAG: glutamate racemase [Parcubacteria group bacterium Gr01-1014_8]|nr:MAG: glutamate racemase [Parcubacteria group bacterium Gr01-1014_8]
MIGLFDSGSGGLTVLDALRKKAPNADIVYFGDIKNAPYGTRSKEELASLTTAGIRMLQNFGTDELISACNSAALSVLLGAAGHARIIDMTRPTARAMRQYAGKRVLLLATPATIISRLYSDALETIVLLDPLPIAELAAAIEFGASRSTIRDIVRSSFRERKGRQYDLVLLGCTHYPLARDIIEREAEKMFGKVEYIDPAEAVAEEAAQRFHTEGRGKLAFKISKDSDHFRKRVAELWPDAKYTIQIT